MPAEPHFGERLAVVQHLRRKLVGEQGLQTAVGSPRIALWDWTYHIHGCGNPFFRRTTSYKVTPHVMVMV